MGLVLIGPSIVVLLVVLLLSGDGLAGPLNGPPTTPYRPPGDDDEREDED
jgi:predicted small lipoprotein YifL